MVRIGVEASLPAQTVVIMIRSFVFFLLLLPWTMWAHGVDNDDVIKALRVELNSDGSIKRISLNGSSTNRKSVSKDAMAMILSLENAESLSFHGTEFNDEMLKQLEGFADLQLLDLSYSAVTDECSGSVLALKNLNSLNLEGASVTDEFLKQIAAIENLATLRLGNTRITDQGLGYLKDHKSLKFLDLSGCQITDSGLANLGKPPRLQHLVLAKPKRWINPSDSFITDKCVDYLLTLETLQTLDIGEATLSSESMTRLKKGLKGAKVSIADGETFLR